MSGEKHRHEADRWIEQARADLRAAELSTNGKSYEWACFQAQQSAEKALKGLWYAGGHDPWGHSLLRLVREYPESAVATTLKESLAEVASTLDQYYVPTRYPNGLPDLTPHEVYTERQAVAARKAAESVIEEICRLVEQ